VAVACLLVTSDLEARAQIPTAAASLQSIDRHLSGLRTELGRAQRRLAGARTRGQAVTRSFDSAQSALSATQATLSGDERGIHSQGVDLGALDTCLSDVEQALNQFAVGQTTGGLVSLRASSTACSVLDEVG
jgi:chromosome segregation ATPase